MSDTDTIAQAGTEVEAGGEAAAEAVSSAGQRAGAAAQRAGEVLTDVAGNVATTVQEKAPVVIEVSRSTASKAAREVQGASNDELQLGTVFSAGLALGLLLARAPRLLVWAAVIPVVVLGGTLLGRRAGMPMAGGNRTSAPARKARARSS